MSLGRLTFNITLPLAKYLQKPDIELSAAIRYTDDVISLFEKVRQPEEKESEPGVLVFEEFSTMFEKAEKLMQDTFNCKIEVPRQARKQTQRDNVPHQTPEEYYRRSVFLPCIDAFLQGLHDRFGKNRKVLESFDILLPKTIDPAKVDRLKHLNIFLDENVSETLIKNEYILWCHKWEKIPKEKRPERIMAVIDECNVNFYENINYLLKVLATLPVSTCEVERSFSSLKRIKTYLRNTMENERLNGLALMSIHYPVPFTADQVLDEMAKNQKRKLIL